MHEATIAMAIVEQAAAVAAQHGAARITAIEVELGALKQVVPEALDLAFEACAEGTLAEGAVLSQTVRPAVALCRPCGREFEPDLIALSFACPSCGRADVEIIAGHEIVLKAVECDTPAETPLP